MARCSLTTWKPLGDNPTHQPLMSRYDLVIVHTMVGTLAGTDAMFRGQGYVGVESHFGTGYIGGKVTAYQWGDTARTADANLQGNPRAISIENADMGDPFPAWSGSNVPAFTDDQAELIAQICAWACKTHGIPAQLAPNSLPGSRGIAWHRQGIDPWRVSGGEKWSESTGKVCPGDRRIAQIKDTILPRVKAILDGKGNGQGQGGEGEDLGPFPAVREVQWNIGWSNNRLRAQRDALEEFAKVHPNMPAIAAAIAELNAAIPAAHDAHDALSKITGV